MDVPLDVPVADALRRLSAQSRVRVAAAQVRRREQQLIVRHCTRLLDESRRLLEGRRPPAGA